MTTVKMKIAADSVEVRQLVPAGTRPRSLLAVKYTSPQNESKL
jgi:hypothetical protein